METSENNKAYEDTLYNEQNFTYNFITIPWDDRSRTSKVNIIALLTIIFVATLSIVINNFVIHYRGFDSNNLNSDTNIDCNLVKVDTYPYVARIRSVVNLELICVGAVLSPTSVLANELCLRSGPIRLHLGNPSDPQCKKGLPVDVFEVIPHEGVVTKALVLLSTFEDMTKCATSIKIGETINYKKRGLIIGRPFRGGRSLSLQLVTLVEGRENLTDYRNLPLDKVICVTDLEKCPVRAGDLLIQGGHLFGLASTSVSDRGLKKHVCFANITLVHNEIKSLDATIGYFRN